MVHWLTALLLYAKKENMNSPIKRGDPVIIIEGAPEWMAIETAPVPNAELAEIRANDPVAWRAWNSQHHCYDYGEAGETDPLGRIHNKHFSG